MDIGMQVVVTVVFICGAVALYLIVPAKEWLDQEHSTILISKDTGEVKETTVTVNGEWSTHRGGIVKHSSRG